MIKRKRGEEINKKDIEIQEDKEMKGQIIEGMKRRREDERKR